MKYICVYKDGERGKSQKFIARVIEDYVNSGWEFVSHSHGYSMYESHYFVFKKAENNTGS